MKKFTKAGSVQKVSGTNNWTVKTPFYWWIDYKEQNERIIVHQGFTFDFGSIPRILWWFLNPTEWNSFCLHDFAYSVCYRGDRKFCDTILLQALIAEGCPLWQANLIYYGVRIGGGKTWNNYKKLLLSK